MVMVMVTEVVVAWQWHFQSFTVQVYTQTDRQLPDELSLLLLATVHTFAHARPREDRVLVEFDRREEASRRQKRKFCVCFQ